MVDNVAITAGSGTTIAADDIGGGVLAQRVKVLWGPDNTGNDTDVASGKPLPVQMRVSDGTAWTYGSGTTAAGTPRVVLASDSVNANGQTTMSGSSPVTIASNQATIATAEDSISVGNGSSATPLVPKFSVISCSSSGPNTILTPTAGKRVLVLSWLIKVNAAVNFKFVTSTGSVDLTGLFYNSAQGDGAGGSYNPKGHFRTSTNSDTLILNLSGAVAVGGYFTYVEF